MAAISAIMPVRDGERWLAPAIDSLLAQDFADFELLIVDDGSADSTPEILTRYAARDRRIRLFHQPRLGLAPALNLALANATAPLIARLDADDVALPSRFSRQKKFLDTVSACGLAGAWAEKIDEAGNRIGLIKPATEDSELKRALRKDNPFIHSSVMFRTEIARNAGGYRAFFEAAEDYDLWQRISSIASVANIPEPLIRYRWHPENVTQRNRLRQAFSVRLAKHAAALRAVGKEPDDVNDGPPDWRTVDAASWYAEDVKLYRLLALDEIPLAALDEILPDALDWDKVSPLSSAERRWLAAALSRLARSPDRSKFSQRALLKAAFRAGPVLGLKFLAGL
jgi:glycosyltransferase involved in cell wall biosynthesis